MIFASDPFVLPNGPYKMQKYSLHMGSNLQGVASETVSPTHWNTKIKIEAITCFALRPVSSERFCLTN